MSDGEFWVIIIFLGIIYFSPYWILLLISYAADSIVEESPEQKEKNQYDSMDRIGKLLIELDTPYSYGITPFVPGEAEAASRRINEVVEELQEIGDLRAVRPLINHAEKRFKGENGIGEWPYADYKLAIKALGKFNDQESLDYLIKILTDKDINIRRAAVEALDSRGWKPE